MKQFNKILINGFDQSEINPIFWKRIKKVSKKIVWLPLNSPNIITHLKNTDCLLVKFNPEITKEWINDAPKLKYIGTLATGYGKIDYRYAGQKGIAVTNIPGYATESVAEFVFAIILAHIRNLKTAQKNAGKSDFNESKFMVTELKDKNFGIIGTGSIGSRTAEIARGFGCKVSYWSKNRKINLEKSKIKYLSLNKVLSKSDFISIHLSLNLITKGFFNKTKIRLIKKGAVIVNTAPMELFDIPALINRLKKNDITFIWDHPDETEEKYVIQLLKLKNCITYPPIGYISNEAKIRKQEIFTQNMENFVKGKPSNKIN